MKNIVVFASGSGSNFQSIIDACQSGIIFARVTGLLTSKNNIGALERAASANIPSRVLIPADFESDELYESALHEQLEKWNPDLIVLAGYLRKVPNSVIHTYPNRILNIHPSLLPKFGGKGFYGMKVHQAVIEAGETESGCTVHLVNEVYDDGEVLGQIVIPVNATDTPQTLAARVLKEEHILYPQIIQKHLEILD